MGLLTRLADRFRRNPPRYNLHIRPAFAIKASAHNPYFQNLERAARAAGCLGEFIVFADGRLRPGTHPALETRTATLALDVYPNPAALEGRTVADYASPAGPRRTPRITLVLADDTELYLRRTPKGPVVEEPAPRFPR